MRLFSAKFLTCQPCMVKPIANSVQLRPVTSENLAIFSRKYELVFMVSKVPVLHSWYLYESTIQVLSVDYLTNRNQLTN